MLDSRKISGITRTPKSRDRLNATPISNWAHSEARNEGDTQSTKTRASASVFSISRGWSEENYEFSTVCSRINNFLLKIVTVLDVLAIQKRLSTTESSFRLNLPRDPRVSRRVRYENTRRISHF